MATPPPPIILSLIPCERVIQNAQSGDYSLIDILARVRSPEFPVTAPSFAIFFEFTGGRGNVSLLVRIVDADEARPPICEVRAAGSVMEGPLSTASMAITLPGVTFPAPGEYRIQVWHEGELLRERKLVFGRLEPSGAVE
jgi:hypothetical protein